MKTGENRLESQQKTESPQVKQEGVKQEEVETMHEVEQNKEFFKRESEENAMNKGCLKKKLSAKTTDSMRTVFMLTKKRVLQGYGICFVDSKKACEREVVLEYVDTYSG